MALIYGNGNNYEGLKMFFIQTENEIKISPKDWSFYSNIPGNIYPYIYGGEAEQKEVHMEESISCGHWGISDSGWVCPKCGRVCGPSISECQVCNSKINK